jgi:ribosome-binding ATPase YchF (GTP1/OBG family)
MKDIGLVGVPFSGRSTLFTALTHAGSHGGQANVAVVPVPDPRLDVLTEMERSKKTVHAQVRFVDVPGGTSSAQGIAKLREVEALAIVVRYFGPDQAPASELADVRADLLLADLAVIEGSLQKAEKKARGKPGPEVEALKAAKAALDAETPLRDAGLDPALVTELRGIAPLTLKPEVVIANLEEGTDVPVDLPGAAAVYAAIEAEVAEMDPDEARALLEEFGVREPGLQTVIAACYRALDLITFLTTGEDETRSWEVARVHPRRGDRLRRTRGAGLDGGGEGPRQAPRRGQGLRGAGGRHPARAVRGVGVSRPARSVQPARRSR